MMKENQLVEQIFNYCLLFAEDVIRMDLGETGLRGVDWIRLAQDRDLWRDVASAVMKLHDLAPWNWLVIYLQEILFLSYFRSSGRYRLQKDRRLVFTLSINSVKMERRKSTIRMELYLHPHVFFVEGGGGLSTETTLQFVNTV
jgi:hypothetical protein